MTTTLEPLRRAKTILLTTYKRDGTPVATPVSIAFEGDRAFFRTWHNA
jgi:PPOX class probable F420-dependent enzyme